MSDPVAALLARAGRLRAAAADAPEEEVRALLLAAVDAVEALDERVAKIELAAGGMDDIGPAAF